MGVVPSGRYYLVLSLFSLLMMIITELCVNGVGGQLTIELGLAGLDVQTSTCIATIESCATILIQV